MIVVGTDPNPAQRLRHVQAKKIRALRNLRGLTLRSLADEMCKLPNISVTSAAISEWERGVSTPRQHMQVALAKALDTTWSSLFDLDGQS